MSLPIYFPCPSLSLVAVRDLDRAGVASLAINLRSTVSAGIGASILDRFRVLRDEMLSRQAACREAVGAAAWAKMAAEVAAFDEAFLVCEVLPTRRDEAARRPFDAAAVGAFLVALDAAKARGLV